MRHRQSAIIAQRKAVENEHGSHFNLARHWFKVALNRWGRVPDSSMDKKWCKDKIEYCLTMVDDQHDDNQ